MDVFFQPQHGTPFSIEIGYFDSVLEIKQKIHTYYGIPVAKQVLVFNGSVLNDDLNVHYSEILDRSCINLIMDDSDHRHVNCRSNGSNGVASAPSSIADVKLPPPPPPPPPEEESPARLKEKIEEVARLTVHSNGVELLGNQCEEDEVPARPSSGGKKMKVLVLTRCGKRKVPLDVSPAENVGQLREELQKVSQSQNLDLNLPQEGYFFIYKQNVMDDDRSFRWHRVRNGDTIEIFNGTISGGT